MRAEAAASEKVLPHIMRAATGLAASFFTLGEGDGDARTITRDDVLFVLDGHIADWSEWRNLTTAEARRFMKLIRRRTNQMANAEAAGRILDQLLESNAVAGCTAAADYKQSGEITVDPGMPLPDFVDRALRDLDVLHAATRRSLPPAVTGLHTTTTRVPGPRGFDQTFVDFRYEIRTHHLAPDVPLAVVADAPARDELAVPFKELERIAERIDADVDGPEGSGFRAKAVRRFADQIRDRKGERVEELRLTAGTLSQLLAYTGFGKSVVLIETFACWAVEHGVTVGFVLPTNADVVRATFQIERAVERFRQDADVVPLVSPRSLLTVAEEAVARISEKGPDADWIWSRFGYGCALAAVASADEAIDGWQPGDEPCATLRRPSRRGKRDETVSCPWRTTCGRYRAARSACTADVIVTSHANFSLGVLQTPVDDGFGENDRLTAEELILRRCQVVVIDEVDAFQQFAIDNAGRHLVLDHAGRTNTPLRRFDQDFGAAFGRLRDEVDASVRDSYFGLRYLSENYVSHLSYERLGSAAPPNRRRPRGPSRYWLVPRRWDNWLTSELFGVEPDEVTEKQLRMFVSLFPGESDPLPDEPEEFAEVRRHLAAVVTGGSGGLAIPEARAALDRLYAATAEDDRAKVVNRVLRRAILERIRFYLHRLMANNAQLVDIGVESAADIADALGTYGRWRVTPTGPLGRLVFAFTEHYDDTGGDPARLSTAAFGGDPHTYTIGLGDTTALAHAGTRRIVVGLSATSYFPGAPHHHVHVKPAWWVADDNPGSVRIEAAPVQDPHGELRKISGLDGLRRTEATRRIATALWGEYLQPELDRLKTSDPERARILLATTSYAAARHVAEGLSVAGVAAHRICLAVRLRPDDGPLVLDDFGQWREIPADRLEDFAALRAADILIAPLARVQRGVNIIGAGDRSALGSVWLIVRPIPLIDEPAELLAHIQAKALAEHPGPASDPRRLLALRRKTAGKYFETIVRRPPYFQAQPEDVKLGVVAEIINGAVQLIGRARRGGTSAVLHLVDGAFHDAKGGSDLATLIRLLEKKWGADSVLTDLRKYHGTTLGAFLDYAARASNGGDSC
ncbi:hypothetical protein [Actinomadura rayongensis]|nr:hypothetical protein [Actinomadura rayongensis]